MLGVLRTSEAIAMAESEGLDLLEIVSNVNPPVCKIVDYGKFRYEQQKNAHKTKAKQNLVRTKEVKIRPNIAIGDMEIKIKNAKRFIEDGDKVKIILSFRGREITHNQIGYDVMNKFKEDMLSVSKIESDIKMEGKHIFMVLAPISKRSSIKN
ncbi:Translation initiation factor IF-3 [Lyticum sinuosum]|uniref:Translation initiation factor IF-3 n=2 Tax=Lyticum sinuosum TaxID=1332059 RepID=A0AAE4VLY9_9RICK|nr:Translation initiation factor IF-3 [Lyticum sinuosum]